MVTGVLPPNMEGKSPVDPCPRSPPGNKGGLSCLGASICSCYSTSGLMNMKLRNGSEKSSD